MINKIHTFNSPGTITFGNNSLSQLSQVATELSAKSICVVTDPGVSEAGILEKTLNVLAETKADVVVFDAVEPEPDIKSIDRCAKLAIENKVDLFIGLGGGSPMDVLKGAAIVTKHGGSIFDYLGVDNVPGPTITKILIPTTAGTGSEVTPFAVFKDKEKQLKTAIQSKFVMGDRVIVDPLLTLSCPPKVTAVCGMDALTHAIESFTSINASPMSEQYRHSGDPYDRKESSDSLCKRRQYGGPEIHVPGKPLCGIRNCQCRLRGCGSSVLSGRRHVPGNSRGRQFTAAPLCDRL